MKYAACSSTATNQREIFFVDANLPGIETLVSGLPAGAPCHLIDPASDGVRQVADVLAHCTGLAAVHILSHGAPGALQLGNAWIDRGALAAQAGLWTTIGEALDAEGDLLLYACELASGQRGVDFLDQLAALTGANVAASRDLTGAAALGGNWELAAILGSVKTPALSIPAYAGVLASPTIITTTTLNPAFNAGVVPGIVTTQAGGAADAQAYAVVIDGDGKIVTAGYRNGGADSDFVIVRYNADGSLDDTFNVDPVDPAVFGPQTAFNGGASGEANALAIAADGGIVAVGLADTEFAVASFDSTGAPVLEITGSFDAAATGSTANAVDFDSNDNIVIAGTATFLGGDDFAVARFLADGNLDIGFSGDGRLTTDIGVGTIDSATAMTVLAGDEVLVAGWSDDETANGSNFTLVNYLANGDLDTSFNSTGIVNADFAGGFDAAKAMAIDADGKIVLAGTRSNGATSDFVIARYNTNGSLDTSFGDSGWVVTDFGGQDDALAVAIQASGKIVVSGNSFDGAQDDMVFARYNADGSLDTSFDVDGKMTVADIGGVNTQDVARGLAVAANGNIIAVGTSFDAVEGLSTMAVVNLVAPDTSAPALAAIVEGAVNPAGATVFSLVGSNFNDTDPGDALGGVAISGNASNPAQGLWQYSSNGTDWFDVGSVSGPSALLVAATDLLRFLPAADFSGTPGGLELHLVDTLTGIAITSGATIATTTLGVSVDSIALATSVTALQDVPVLTGAPASLPPGTEDFAYTVSLAQLVTGWTDADGDTLDVANLVANHGSVTDNGDGTYTVAPVANYFGPVVLNYDVIDGNGGIVPATLSFTLAASPDNAPVGTVDISNPAPTEGEFLLATLSEFFDDPDGLPIDGDDQPVVSYQWQSRINGVFTDIAGENLDFFFPTEAEVGLQLRVVASYTDLLGNFEQVASAPTAIVGDSVTGTEGAETLTGTAGADFLDGLAGNDVFSGLAGNDFLFGGDGNDFLNGGTGADEMTGGDGNDTYVVDNAGDLVNESTGVDMIYSALLNYTLGAGVENLRILSNGAADGTGNGLNNILVAGSGNNVLDGSTGIDTASYVAATAGVTLSLAVAGVQATGGSGSDTLIGIENLTGSNFADSLTGNAAANVLNGGLGNDILDGGAGNDTLIGGLGNDTYVVDSALDVINESSALVGEIDTVQSSVTRTLGANLENLLLTGAAAINGTGNALDNTLAGNAAANVLNGGLGADTMSGGNGNDVYYVDNLGDVVTETNVVLATGGNDMVFTSVNYILGANLENLRVLASGAVNGTGNDLNNTLVSGSGNNVLDGSTGIDTASYVAATAGVTLSLAVAGAQATGGSGLDTLIGIESLLGSNFDDSLTGDANANVLIGGLGNDALGGAAGNDVLLGGIGNDTLIGGLGNDVFRFDAVGFGNDSILDFDAIPVGGQDRINIGGLGITAASFAGSVSIADVGADTLVTIGADSIRLVGVADATTVTQTDFVLA